MSCLSIGVPAAVPAAISSLPWPARPSAKPSKPKVRHLATAGACCAWLAGGSACNIHTTGLALAKPVQLPRLTALLGGYDGARAIHLLVLALLAVFLVVHLVQVALHPRTLLDMASGGRRPGGAIP